LAHLNYLTSPFFGSSQKRDVAVATRGQEIGWKPEAALGPPHFYGVY